MHVPILIDQKIAYLFNFSLTDHMFVYSIHEKPEQKH